MEGVYKNTGSSHLTILKVTINLANIFDRNCHPRMLEMVFPSLEISKVSGGACPETSPAPPTFGAQKFLPFFIACKRAGIAGFSIRAGGRQNLLSIWHELATYFLGGNYPSLNRVFMCCHWIKEPKFNDVCVLSNTLIFAPECWDCIIRGPDFKIFPEAHKSHLCY